jgi:hypothetical protein
MFVFAQLCVKLNISFLGPLRVSGLGTVAYACKSSYLGG